MDRLQQFVKEVAALVDAGGEEAPIVEGVREAMQRLVAEDDWLPAEFTRAHPQYYQQYLLHADARDRFSVVSFVWGPGQKTPVHDHTVWGVIGMLRGSEISTPYRMSTKDHFLLAGTPKRLTPGEIDRVSPLDGDIHQVSNAFADKASISIHLY